MSERNSRMNEILQRLISCEALSNSIAQVSSIDETNSEIKWTAYNSLCNYKDHMITEKFLNDEYAKVTRWDLWQEAINIFIDHDIKINLDIGCANNHFSYLCNTNKIVSFGIEPRKQLVDFSNENFRECGINEKHAFLGSIKTFNESFFGSENLLDCVSVINFMHGNYHSQEDLMTLFEVLSGCTKYVFTSMPINESCRNKLLQHFESLKFTAIDGRMYGMVSHAFFINKNDLTKR